MEKQTMFMLKCLVERKTYRGGDRGRFCVSCFLRRSSYGNRTHDSAVRGQRLNPLTNEPFVFCFAELSLNASHILSEPKHKCKHFFHFL